MVRKRGPALHAKKMTIREWFAGAPSGRKAGSPSLTAYILLGSSLLAIVGFVGLVAALVGLAGGHWVDLAWATLFLAVGVGFGYQARSTWKSI